MTPNHLVGQNLGKYRILEPLGRGGMARVYRAYHPQLDRYVAIKVLRSDLVEEEEFLARFQREARAVAALRHPHIVQVFDFDVEDEAYYMVMELLEGDTLKARLNDHRARGERMPLDEMVRILLDVLDGLAYAHSEGMVHRDVKPANIMLTRRGQAVITDFGIAQIVGGTRHTASGALMGTLNYMAPEQGLEGQGDVRSDIYSLGITFYEMLTGRPPFDADTPLAILMKHLNDPLPLPRQIDQTIPSPFERIVLKALAKRPEDRYQSAEEMVQALREAAQEVGLTLPGHVSLPPAPEPPADAVAVFSGTAREQIPDARFAHEETDARMGQRLAEERAATEVVEAEEETRPARELPDVWKAILASLVIIATYNMIAVMVSGFAGRWILFDRGWPVEILLVSLGLGIVTALTTAHWMLIPTGIILGNGLLLSYYALTGNWDHWSFLWPLELILIVVTVLGTIWLKRKRGNTQEVVRVLGGIMAFIAIAAAGFIVLITTLATGILALLGII